VKGILLSLISFFLLIVVSFFSIRAYRGKKYFYVFLTVLPFACLFYLLLFYSLPDNLYFLPQILVEPSRLVDFGNGLFILLLLFHIFWDTAYATVLTGFSSELMVRLFREKQRGLSIEELMKEFGAEREMDEILEWRIPNLLNSGYVTAEGSRFRLLKKGRWIAALGLFLKKLFRMDVEG